MKFWRAAENIEEHVAAVDSSICRLVRRPRLIQDAILAREERLQAWSSGSKPRRGLFLKGKPRASPVTLLAIEARLHWAREIDSGALPTDNWLREPAQGGAPTTRFGPFNTRHLSTALEEIAAAYGEQGASMGPKRPASAILALSMPKVQLLAGQMVEIDPTHSQLLQGVMTLLAEITSPSRRYEAFVRASLLARGLSISDAKVEKWRRQCDAFHTAGLLDDERFVLFFLLALNDIEGVLARIDRQPSSVAVEVFALMPESDTLRDGQVQSEDWREIDADAIIIADVPEMRLLYGTYRPYVCAHPIRGLASIADAPAGTSGAVTGFSPPYSDEEEALCELTQAFADELLSLYVQPFEGTSLSFISRLLRASALRFDDVLFAALLPAWASLQAIRKSESKTVAIATADPGFAGSLSRMIVLAVPQATVRVRMPVGLDSWSEPDSFAVDADEVPANAIVGAVGRWLAGAHGRDTSARAYEPAADSTLFAGRPFDRNYTIDAKSLVAIAMRTGPVHFMPTAMRKEGGETFRQRLDRLFEDARGVTFWTGAEEQARTLKARSIPALLLDHARNVENRFLSAVSPESRALLTSALPQLRRLLERVAPEMILSACHVREAFYAAQPTRIICLPGRDWIARMLVAEMNFCRRSSDSRSVSIDLQTVFVGPRRRYKPTSCDFQFAIESYSRDLFTGYFGLRADQVVVVGSPRYASSLSSSRLHQSIQGAEATQTGEPWGLLYTASPTLARCLPVVGALGELLEQYPRFSLRIRPHPSTTQTELGELRQLVQQFGGRAALEEGRPLGADIAKSNCVVTRFSNTGLEAAMAGKPVIACEFGSEPPPIPLDTMGVALPARNAAGLENALVDVWQAGPLCTALAASRAVYLSRNAQLLSEDVKHDIWRAISAARRPS